MRDSGRAPPAPARPAPDPPTPGLIDQAIKGTPDAGRKTELRLIKSNLDALKAWVVGAQVKGREMVGMVPIHEALLQVMLDGGWGWGGDWTSAMDYMHFEDRGAMDSLKMGGDAPAKK